ncbi:MULTISPECIES: type II toxin-antitoxin system HipA family toxin [Yersinia]|uniref:type II toxin-antitoxin system HipA family toxin n=1 Tax=Yersinia TaxID=629 RepID=UPI0011A8A3D2|nr:HipA domain-containing protein [Yersinia kristensenii]MBW5814199.1 type II toxin-antitoxin system HipA family toxin [Yersinia kristensenii]MBW5818876.1 type II toxin-antitoxin system HipA family toxin [Yersinia kristensenii]MBW5831387.1 type II toxin-antitoxin system HipA family toxin [Yersinia kristensenii]MBW5844151.1 type II toxin-antitoxin system HipA family toxin [Yersinia kristensenii]MDA5490226.1 HipA domain-containing protein [Yersinia kristensenii]
MKLDVQVSGKNVAKLFRERDEYLLKYLPGISENNFISLTMPVRDLAWRWPRDLHPFFRQNLPEGYLLGVIREEFGPLLDGTDLSLLAVIGGTGIGRVTVTPEGVEPGFELDPLQIEELLKGNNTAAHFASLVRRYARAAVSGVVPKFLSPDRADVAPLGKPTLRTSKHIIKGSDENTPFLGFNEFYTMRVLERLKVTPVATSTMSDDGRILVVERFDVDAEGHLIFGLEDACSLLGMPPHEKYATTMEKVLNATRVYIPKSGVRQQMEALGWLILTNFVIRNADCHAKNIALLYTSAADVAYTPAYDLVTTQAYPRFGHNPPALSIEGRQTWAVGKSLERFFNHRLGIPPRRYAEMVEILCESAVEVGREMIEAAKNEPLWREITKQMFHAWNEGMSSLRSPKATVEFRSMVPLIEVAGFSDAHPPENEKESFGRSELLARRAKSKK